MVTRGGAPPAATIEALLTVRVLTEVAWRAETSWIPAEAGPALVARV
jgi:hypothetical protein